MEIDLDRPQTVYIVRNLDGRYCLHFDEPHLEKMVDFIRHLDNGLIWKILGGFYVD